MATGSTKLIRDVLVQVDMLGHKKRKLMVTGDTKPIRDVLKAMGGKWTRSKMGWLFPSHRHDELLCALQKVAAVAVPDDGSEAPVELETRRLPDGWEHLA
jgi:hypothetical protein